MIELQDEPVSVAATIAALLAMAGCFTGIWVWWGFVAAGVAGSIAVALYIALMFLLLIDAKFQWEGGIIALARSLVRLRRARTASFAASLCPHGVLLRKPGADPVLLPWSRVRQIGVLPRWRRPVVVATLAHGTDPVGMPAVHRLLRGTPTDPELRWLGRVPRGRTEAVQAGIESWHLSQPGNGVS